MATPFRKLPPAYLHNQLLCDVDPYGRRKYYGYRASDGTLIRTVTATHPGYTLADFDAVWSLTHTEATGSAIAATESFTYDLRNRQLARTDYGSNTWTQIYDSCCDKQSASVDPLGRGTADAFHTSPSRKIREGRVEFTITRGGGC